MKASKVKDKRKMSAYLEDDPKKTAGKVLKKRPAGAPSILEECETPIKLRIWQNQSPGDIIMLSAAIRDLQREYPTLFRIEMKTTCSDIWMNNKYITKFTANEPDVHNIRAGYTELINTSSTGAHHFIHGFRKNLEDVLGIPIKQGLFKGDIHLTQEERNRPSQVWTLLKKEVPYWIIDAGHKHDFTCKMWEHARYQQVVDSFPDITFVQVGRDAKNHTHKPLTGQNVVNLVGKTSLREFMRVMYHAAGVITPVSMPMHMSAAIDMNPVYGRKIRPCIVIAGGREANVWEQYTGHQFMHTCGQLPCCEGGGCWASRVEPLFDGDAKDTRRMCQMPVQSASGQVIPECMNMITVSQICQQIRSYLNYYEYSGGKENWKSREYTIPEHIKKKRDDARNGKQVRSPRAAATPAKTLRTRRTARRQRVQTRDVRPGS
jgi:ADP-heptose:LPS heptosyltransferase